jgi:hypothetical protein
MAESGSWNKAMHRICRDGSVWSRSFPKRPAAHRSHFDQIHRFCRQCEEVIRFSVFPLFQLSSVLFCSVSFSFPPFLFCVSHFPRRFFFLCLFKPITTMLHFRKTLQEPEKAFAAMNCTSAGRHTDLSFVNENAADSILRNIESDSIETDESPKTGTQDRE